MTQTKPKKQQKRKYNEDGMRLTDCCGCYSTFCMDTGELVCKKCFKVVEFGEGDGSEYKEEPKS